MNKLFSGVGLGWLGRRVMDYGGWIGTFLLGLIGIYNSLPANVQALIGRVIQGGWQEITLGAIAEAWPAIFALVASQVVSYRATVKDQVVAGGKKVDLPDLPTSTQVEVKRKVNAAPTKKRDTVFDTLRNIFTH